MMALNLKRVFNLRLINLKKRKKKIRRKKKSIAKTIKNLILNGYQLEKQKKKKRMKTISVSLTQLCKC